MVLIIHHLKLLSSYVISFWHKNVIFDLFVLFVFTIHVHIIKIQPCYRRAILCNSIITYAYIVVLVAHSLQAPIYQNYPITILMYGKLNRLHHYPYRHLCVGIPNDMRAKGTLPYITVSHMIQQKEILFIYQTSYQTFT